MLVDISMILRAGAQSNPLASWKISYLPAFAEKLGFSRDVIYHI
jgi:hypothetical protein